MALDDELAALERQLLMGPTGDWLTWLDKVRQMSVLGSPGLLSEVMSQWEPDLYQAVQDAMNGAYATGAAHTLDGLETASAEALDISEEAMTQASVAANSKPPKDLNIAKNALWINDDAAAALEKVRQLLSAGVEPKTAVAPLLQHANRVRYGITTGITDAGNAGVEAVSTAVDLPMVWVAERNACVRCLAHQGHVVQPGGKFPAGLTFGSAVLDDAVSRPPLHGHCRCHLETLHAPSYAEALKREAQRSVLRGFSLENESMKERIHAADKLLKDPELVAPASVKKYAAKAVKAGAFPTRDPFSAPPPPPRPAAQSKPAPKAPKPPAKPAPKAAKPTPKAAPKKTATPTKVTAPKKLAPPPPQPKPAQISESDAAAIMYGPNSPQHKKALAKQAKSGPVYHAAAPKKPTEIEQALAQMIPPDPRLKTPKKVTQPKPKGKPENFTPPDRATAKRPMSDAEVKAYTTANMKNPKSFTSAQREALYEYSGPGYTVNSQLRRGEKPDDYRVDMMKGLDAAIKRDTLKHDLATTRMVKPGVFAGLVDDPRNYNQLVGKVLSDPGYTSTAVGGFPATGWEKMPIQMNLLVPKGTPAVYMAPVSGLPFERELLLGRDTDILIESVEEVDGKWHVNATVLPRKK